jgi:hypothetical protein
MPMNSEHKMVMAFTRHYLTIQEAEKPLKLDPKYNSRVSVLHKPTSYKRDVNPQFHCLPRTLMDLFMQK